MMRDDMSQIASVQQQFGPNAERYARASYFGKQDSLDELIRVAAPQLNGRMWRMLDVATGGGHCAFAFAPLVGHITATDVTPQMLAAARVVAQERGLSNITFEPADAQDLPYADAMFDLVVCRIAAHHFSDPGQAVREMARVCKPGGLVGLIDPIVPSDRRIADEINAWELTRDPSTTSVLTVNGWSSLFCAAGLDAVHINTFDIPLDFDDLLLRSSRDAETTAQLRAGLLGGSDGMRGWLKPEVKEGRLMFVWPQVLVVGRKGS
jgi:ubiquinone/menaquinone biosynthesis C-methylase UbiE